MRVDNKNNVSSSFCMYAICCGKMDIVSSA